MLKPGLFMIRKPIVQPESTGCLEAVLQWSSESSEEQCDNKSETQVIKGHLPDASQVNCDMLDIVKDKNIS